MWDEYLVSRLSSKASQVLLSLLLTRQVQNQKTAMEFAKLTGLGQRSIAPALLELKSAGLIDIIHQPGKPPLVRLVHPEEYRYETTVTAVGPTSVEEGTQGLLLASGDGDAREVGATKDDTPRGPGLAAPGERAPEALIKQCRKFDAWTGEGKRDLQIAALQDVWDYAFPVEEYPNQRLSNSNARQLLVNRSAEWVGQFVLDRVSKSASRILAPLPYIQAALAGEEKKNAQQKVGEGPAINDDLRKLVQLGKKQFVDKDRGEEGAKSKDSPGDIE